jgi:hypothetical protein
VNQSVGLAHGYKFDCDRQPDSSWTQYLNVLYPSDEQREVIENRRLMDRMKRQGDKLELARDVTHWAHFKNQADRETFREAIRVLGYRIESEDEDPGSEYSHSICMTRRQEMNSDAVDEAVIQLFRACKNAHGQYNGWECELIIDAEPETEK